MGIEPPHSELGEKQQSQKRPVLLETGQIMEVPKVDSKSQLYQLYRQVSHNSRLIERKKLAGLHSQSVS